MNANSRQLAALRSEVANLKSISWYLQRLKSRLDEYEFPENDRYLQAVAEAVRSLDELVEALPAPKSTTAQPSSATNASSTSSLKS